MDSICFPTERSCGHPGTLEYGVITGNDFTYGKVVSFKCNNGFLLTGSSARTCQTNGIWTGTQPTCNGRYFEVYVKVTLLL
jgi:CUB/sushi domain-containing protein